MLTIRICMDGAYATLAHQSSTEHGHHFSTPDGRFCITLAPDFALPAEPAPDVPKHSRAEEVANAARVVQLVRLDAQRAGVELDLEDVQLQAEKYVEYGVPIDTAARTILRHLGVPMHPLARLDDLDLRLRFGRHKGLRLGDVPLPYLAWLAADPKPDSSFLVPEDVRDAARRIQAARSGAQHG